MSDAEVIALLEEGESRGLANVLRAAHELTEASARRVLEHFRASSAKGVAWMAGLDESETTLLLGHLRARAGEVG